MMAERHVSHGTTTNCQCRLTNVAEGDATDEVVILGELDRQEGLFRIDIPNLCDHHKAVYVL